MDEFVKCLIGILMPFIGTTLGASVVFLFKNTVSDKVQKVFLGFAAGVMIAASIWSLIIPAIEMSTAQGSIGWIPAVTGIVIGTIFLLITDFIIEKNESKSDLKKRTKILNFAITLHNIPEGMIVGSALASVLTGNFGMEFMSAIILSIGIAIQNFPEGMAISLPYKADGYCSKEAFKYGVLSGVVEPVAAVITLLISSIITSILPYLLTFAAGSMLYVVIGELIPNSHEGKSSKLSTISVIIGFLIMMILDVSLG